jgi:hypothetical protein
MMARSDRTNVAFSAEPHANVLLKAHRLDADRRWRRLSPDRGHFSAR